MSFRWVCRTKLSLMFLWFPIRGRPGTKFRRGRDQVVSAGAGINRDFELLPGLGPGPGLSKIGRGRDFYVILNQNN